MCHGLSGQRRQHIIGFIKNTQNGNTSTAYKTYAEQYKRFAAERGIETVAAESLCEFMMHGLLERDLSRSTLTDMIPAAVEDMFRYEASSPGRDEPALMKGIKKAIRSLTKPSVPRKPILRAQLERMATGAGTSPHAVRDRFILILMFVGCLRESEAVQLLNEDVHLGKAEDGSEILYVRIRKSKTDQYGENATIVISGCRGSPICPVMWYKRHRTARRESTFLFHKIPKGSVAPLGKTTPNELIKKHLRSIGVDPKGYGSHSLRRGGATAVAVAKVRMYILKRHGPGAAMQYTCIL